MSACRFGCHTTFSDPSSFPSGQADTCLLPQLFVLVFLSPARADDDSGLGQKFSACRGKEKISTSTFRSRPFHSLSRYSSATLIGNGILTSLQLAKSPPMPSLPLLPHGSLSPFPPVDFSFLFGRLVSVHLQTSNLKIGRRSCAGSQPFQVHLAVVHSPIETMGTCRCQTPRTRMQRAEREQSSKGLKGTSGETQAGSGCYLSKCLIAISPLMVGYKSTSEPRTTPARSLACGGVCRVVSASHTLLQCTQ